MKNFRGKCLQEAEAVAVVIGAVAAIEAALGVKEEAAQGAVLGPEGPGLGAVPGLDPDPEDITTTRVDLEGVSALAPPCPPGGVTPGTGMHQQRPVVLEYLV